eukprot:m51a1_g9165 putative tubulin-specific chaperone d (909) ;mRNA; f:8490-12422
MQTSAAEEATTCASPDELGDEESLRQTFVAEAEELRALAGRLCAAGASDDDLAVSCTRFSSILQKYQEQPQLLDRHLKEIVPLLMARLREAGPRQNSLCRAIYMSVKVRGHKTVSRFFPHEVSDVEAVVGLATAQSDTWEGRYVVLLWLSVVVLVPFGLSTIDSTGDLVPRLVAMGKPDTSGSHLAEFFTWAKSELEQPKGKQFLVLGILSTLALIFKTGQRQELLPCIQTIFPALSHLAVSETGILGRKMMAKVMQRIGLTFLKPRVAPWRYQRGSRSILDLRANSDTPSQNADAPTFEQGDDVQVPEECEVIIGSLLAGLRDRDTITRWSSAKGVGRLTGRLPLALADDVVASVLELFCPTETEAAWHGGCLALAELARRGLLLPDRLSACAGVVAKALLYDEPRGAHSVGSNVRDAACYTLASALVTVAVLDREVNCRRAAAAAFQENVGRQGNYPHGIEIVTTADFFSLSNRADAYRRISVLIAKFDEYREPLVQHLLQCKIRHWDRSIRDLASQALENLTPLCPSDATAKHIPFLVCSYKIVGIVPSMEDARLFRGRGTEHIRGAACQLIESIATAKLSLKRDPSDEAKPAAAAPRFGAKAASKPRLTQLQETIDECLQHPHEDVQGLAVSAFRSLARSYYINDAGAVSLPKTVEKLVEKYARQVVVDANPADPEMRDAETRRNAVKGICEFCRTVGIGNSDGLSDEQLASVIACYKATMNDYAVDSRGDVGSWVREASMLATVDLLVLLRNNDSGRLTPDMASSMTGEIITQLGQRIDRMRAVALLVLKRLAAEASQMCTLASAETRNTADVDKLTAATQLLCQVLRLCSALSVTGAADGAIEIVAGISWDSDKIDARAEAANVCAALGAAGDIPVLTVPQTQGRSNAGDFSYSDFMRSGDA